MNLKRDNEYLIAIVGTLDPLAILDALGHLFGWQHVVPRDELRRLL